MMSTRFVHKNTHVGFLLIVFSCIKDILCISYKIKYQNEARKQKSIKEVTLQFSCNDLSN
jgi:hypothetical protein